MIQFYYKKPKSMYDYCLEAVKILTHEYEFKERPENIIVEDLNIQGSINDILKNFDYVQNTTYGQGTKGLFASLFSDMGYNGDKETLRKYLKEQFLTDLELKKDNIERTDLGDGAILETQLLDDNQNSFVKTLFFKKGGYYKISCLNGKFGDGAIYSKDHDLICKYDGEFDDKLIDKLLKEYNNSKKLENLNYCSRNYCEIM